MKPSEAGGRPGEFSRQQAFLQDLCLLFRRATLQFLQGWRRDLNRE